MKTKKIIVLFLIIAAVVCLAMLAKNRMPNQSNPSGKMVVTASFYPLAFLAEQIGGNEVQVYNITPAGAEPHDYELTPEDMVKITKSKVLILNGRGLEAWGSNIKQNTDPSETAIITISDGIPLLNIAEEGKTMTDPHLWQDPILIEQIANKIEQIFEKADPKNANAYAANLAALNIKLDELDQSFRAGLANCSKKDIITSHAAFGYLATRYGLTQIPIAGLSPDAEPSPKQLADISNFAKANNIKYIFFESLVSPKLSQTIAAEVGAKTLVLNPIEGLTKEELSQGKNYLSVMRENLANLQIALSCKK